MSTFKTHTIESAPAGAKEILQSAKSALGFVPNLYANLAESPAALAAYTSLSQYLEKSSLSPTEQQVIALTASVINGCEFCVAAHSVIAKKMVRVDESVVNAIRNGKTIDDEKLQALAEFTRTVVLERGWVRGTPLEDFLAAGFSHANAIDVVLGVSMKTLSNYVNHLTETSINEEFSSEAWSRSA